MKNNWILILIVGLAAGLVAACEDSNGDGMPSGPETTEGTACTPENAADVCDGFACNIAAEADAGVCFETCATEAQCVEGFTCADVTPEADSADETADETAPAVFACVEVMESSEPPVPFVFVGVVSTTDDPEGSTPGPNVDAVEVLRDGTSVWAASAPASQFVQGSGNAEPATNDDASALGEAVTRDSFDANAQTCSEAVSAETFSLGATGGYLVVDFGPGFELANGDEIRVWELSNPPCSTFDGGGSVPARNPGDTFEVFIGQADALNDLFEDGWVSLGGITAPGARAFTVAIPE